ncbi:MAG TPA: hypothetical protein VEM38_04505 [Burkholderiales bacterium]|nr:hypothetical protein [Burkholderiales bacterium]
MKIIGIEYRIICPTGRQLEIAVFPLELMYPAAMYGNVHWNVTTHTTEGGRDSRLSKRQRPTTAAPHDGAAARPF